MLVFVQSSRRQLLKRLLAGNVKESEVQIESKMKRPEKIPRCHGMSGCGFSKDIITHSGKKPFIFHMLHWLEIYY